MAPITQLLSEITRLKLVFEDKTIGNENLTPDWVKTLPPPDMNDELDFFIIEFSPIAMKVLSRTNFNALSCCPLPYKERQPILLFQYPGSNLTVGNGSIDKVYKKTIEYNVDTEAGSSGSPVLDNEFKVLGIHFAIGPKKEDNVACKYDLLTTVKTKHASNIAYILASFKEFLYKQYPSVKMQNILLLEWIENIPKNALQFLGSGGYGKVYKAVIEDGIKAVKIIEGFGGLDKYTNQVDALSKEYKVIAALPNHQRKIFWHAFVSMGARCVGHGGSNAPQIL